MTTSMTTAIGDAKPLWRPSAERKAQANVTQFMGWLDAKYELKFGTYDQLWAWSVAQPEAFWRAVWDFFKCTSDTPITKVLGRSEMPGAQWFEGAQVNYAFEILKTAQQSPDQAAIVFCSELVGRQEITWGQLAETSGAIAHHLQSIGVQPGDRVVSYMPNIPQTACALIAAASVGAVWSSCSPDMGSTGVLDRFRQIEPTVLVAVDGYRYGGKDFDRRDVVRELVRELPSLKAVVFVPYLDPNATLALDQQDSARVALHSFAAITETPRVFSPMWVPFDHPLWIVYSSGTTGLPKPIVHGHGGTIIENQKGNQLHLDLKPEDRFFWFSSTSWIMWNLWISTLMVGCTLLQVDGNPGYPDQNRLWKLAEQEKLTFFGASPAFFSQCMKLGLTPAKQFDLSALKTVGATGSPLTQEHYHWIYSEVASDLMLASISGGTDPGTAFLASCPILPVYAGEMQCRGLGCALYAFDEAGRSLVDEVGELVVTQAMPSMPLRFWGDTDGSRYFGSYFDIYPGAWRHGDWLKLIPRPEGVTGVIYGRSDSTINRYGIRMGSSELYRVVEGFPEILDSLVIDLEYLGKPSFLAMFVVLADQKIKHDETQPELAAVSVPDAIRHAVKGAIREQLSARHVPDELYLIPEVPRTLSGKKLEVPVKRLLLGHPVEKAVNRSSMANPQVIDWVLEFARHWQAGVR